MRHAGANIVVPLFKKLTPAQVNEKADPTDLVTVVDQQVEAFFAKSLVELVHGSVLVGEEGAYANPRLTEQLVNGKWVWLVDPLDGTKNFVNHSPDFGIMVVLLNQGHPVASWIYLPVHDVMLTGLRDLGVRRNGEKLKFPFPKQRALGEMRGLVRERDADIQKRITMVASRLNTHCSAIDTHLMLRGEADFIVYGGSNPWDVVAGGYMLELVGGRAAKGDGTPLMGRALTRLEQPFLATRYADDWPTLAEVIFI